MDSKLQKYIHLKRMNQTSGAIFQRFTRQRSNSSNATQRTSFSRYQNQQTITTRETNNLLNVSTASYQTLNASATSTGNSPGLGGFKISLDLDSDGKSEILIN